jgi:protein N-terminal amidase
VSSGRTSLSKTVTDVLAVSMYLLPLARIPPNSLDLLVLPEMCLSGYMFPSASAILPYLEHPRIGPTALLFRELAKRLRCHVVGGYPERIEEEEESQPAGSAPDKPGYNSAMIVSPDGEILGNYRKTFLFETDKTWAREGECPVANTLPEACLTSATFGR